MELHNVHYDIKKFFFNLIIMEPNTTFKGLKQHSHRAEPLNIRIYLGF